VRYAGRLSPEEFWARIAEMEQRVRDTATILPCYGLANWSGLLMVGDWAWENDQLVTVGLGHGDPAGDGPAVHVRTTVHDARREAASLRMTAERRPHDKDDFLRRRHEVDAVPAVEMDIPVDSTPVRFQVWRGADRWWAAADHAAHGLVIESYRMPTDGIKLVRVHDIEPYLAGRRAHLRALRGEA